jgi:phenylalanyl-tRNA synthetase beta chain
MLAAIGFPVDAIEERPVITGVLAGRIEELEKHPNADKLQVGRINVGNGAPLTIATAATNVAQGQTIGVATIGARLPQMTIEPRKMRGIESQGMMISADELALPGDWFENGIMQFDGDLAPGSDLIEYFRLGDAVLDVDITTNRVDAMSMIGLARELAAYQGAILRMPPLDYAVTGDGPQPIVSIETADCRRFAAQRFSELTVRGSPAWMRIRLALAGQRPINNLVDISNYVMLETGQPLHFYDDDRIVNHHLIVRDARPGERLTTLDGEEHELDPDDLVIAGEREVEGLAGLKGGRNSEVTDATRAILLESANFSGPRVRRMSARAGLRTEASTRHEKGLPLFLTGLGQQRAAHLLSAGGAIAHPVHAFGESPQPMDPIPLRIDDIRRLLGYAPSNTETIELLDRLGFAVTPHGERELLVTPPLWRRDVGAAADVIEEIARMAGYDRIEAVLPAVEPNVIESMAYERETDVAHTLCGLGYHEITTVALTGAQIGERFARAGLPLPHTPVEVMNPLSEEQRYLRFALEPACIEYFSRRHSPARVFEIGHTFYHDGREPRERSMMTFAFSAQRGADPAWRDSHFLRLKGDAEILMHRLTGRRDFSYAPAELSGAHPGKTAIMLLDGREIARLFQIDPRLQAAFDAALPMYACSADLQAIPPYAWPSYQARPKYPSTYRDLALVCDIQLPAARIERAIAASLPALCTGVHTFDEYRGPQVPEGKKSVAVRVTLQRPDATITDQEADAAVQHALAELRELGATLRT